MPLKRSFSVTLIPLGLLLACCAVFAQAQEPAAEPAGTEAAAPAAPPVEAEVLSTKPQAAAVPDQAAPVSPAAPTAKPIVKPKPKPKAKPVLGAPDISEAARKAWPSRGGSALTPEVKTPAKAKKPAHKKAPKKAKARTEAAHKKPAGLMDLGTLGGDAAEITGISADGSVAVGNFETAGIARAFRWSKAGGLQDLGTFGGVWAGATAVSADGKVVTGVVRYADDGKRGHAFLWVLDTGVQDLGTFGGRDATPTGISADGRVIVGTISMPDGSTHAFRWTHSGGGVDLGTLGGSAATAGGVSADGKVIVGSVTVAGDKPMQHAFRWTQDTGTQDLGTYKGKGARASAVSADGAAVGGEYIATDGSTRAFLWSGKNGMRDLGAGGTPRGVALDGIVVVGVQPPGKGSHAWRWGKGGVQTLAVLGTDATANAISAEGTVIGGSYLAAGRRHAFVMTGVKP